MSGGNPRPESIRFWEKVDKRAPGECWGWLGCTVGNPKDALRYGSFRLARHGKQVRAHRWAWESVNGSIPNGQTIDHLCRNTLCVNPAHLEVVTPSENVLRGNGPAAIHARKTHCIRGHPLSGDNLYLEGPGKRHCRTCRRQKEKELRAVVKLNRDWSHL